MTARQWAMRSIQARTQLFAFTALVVLGHAATGHAWAQSQDAAKPVYRCPGPPVLYTDGITPQEAREKNCRTIESAAVTVVQTAPRPARPVAGAAPTGVASNGGAGQGSGQGAAPNAGQSPGPAANPNANPSGARPSENRVDPTAQRARDADARRILSEELRGEEERLLVLQREYNNGEPERRGDERNFQRYVERVAEMKASILRKEADIAALRRELAKLPP